MGVLRGTGVPLGRPGPPILVVATWQMVAVSHIARDYSKHHNVLITADFRVTFNTSSYSSYTGEGHDQCQSQG